MVKEAHWHDVELEHLCRSWLEISPDPKVGANQKGKEFWKKIEHHFQSSMTRFRENHPSVLKYMYRSHRAIDTQWGKVSHDCNKFSSAVATIEANNPSGTSWEQRIEQAKVLFRMSIDPEGKEFKFFACWMILKDGPKWKVLSDTNKKKKITKKRKETTAQSSTPSNDGTQDVNEQEDSGDDPEILGTSEHKMIIGTKKAKELAATENRQQKGKEALVESTGKIAAAMNRMASILEEANVESSQKKKENVVEGGLEESWEEYQAQNSGQCTAKEEPQSHLQDCRIGEET